MDSYLRFVQKLCAEAEDMPNQRYSRSKPATLILDGEKYEGVVSCWKGRDTVLFKVSNPLTKKITVMKDDEK